MSFSWLMLTGVVVRVSGITLPSWRFDDAPPATSWTVSRPSRVWTTTSARESAGSVTPRFTPSCITTWSPSTCSPFTVPAFSPATVT